MIQRNVVLVLLAMVMGVMMGCSAGEETQVRSATSNYWDTHKGDCEPVLRSANRYDVGRVAQCMKLFEMYRYVAEIDDIKERSMYAVAFSKVSHLSSDPYDRMVADAALVRICIPRHPLVNGEVVEELPSTLNCSGMSGLDMTGQGATTSNPYTGKRGTVQVRDVPDKDAAKSQAEYKKAMSDRKKKAYSSALEHYRNALELNPFNVGAKYDMACLLSITRDTQGALRALEELYTWNDSEAESRMLKARSDSDFDNIRDNPNFKLLTGYVRISLLNGAGDLGNRAVLSWKKKLEDNDFPVAEVGYSKRIELMPQIWYRAGFTEYATQIKMALGVQKISLSQMDSQTSDSDILVVWGQPEASTLGANQKDPVVTGWPPQGGTNMLDSANQALKDGNSMVGDTQQNIKGTGDTMKSVTSF